jgi:hypothetical protein
VSARDDVDKFIAWCLFNINEHKVKHLYGDNGKKINIIKKYIEQLGSNLDDVMKGIYKSIFSPTIGIVDEINCKLLKVLMKIGIALVPKNFVCLNLDKAANRKLKIIVAIETFTKAYLELDKDDDICNIDILKVRERKLVLKT